MPLKAFQENQRTLYFWRCWSGVPLSPISHSGEIHTRGPISNHTSKHSHAPSSITRLTPKPSPPNEHSHPPETLRGHRWLRWDTR